MFVEGYGHFLRTAASLQWDEAAVDLSADARAWPGLESEVRERLLRLVAGFCVGEAAVAEDIVPFEAAAHDPDAAACFGAQAVDEQRHARFFDRVAAEVAGVPGSGPGERRQALRALLEPEFLELFGERLPAAARALAREDGACETASKATLAAAVGLYHVLLEGIVFTAGQLVLVRVLEGSEPPLPGLRRGVERVLADERWHVGLGARLLDDLGTVGDASERLLAEGARAVGAWGDAVDAELRERVLALHRRRLRATARAAA